MRTLGVILLLMVSTLMKSQSAIIGVWLIQDGEAKVEIQKKDDKYFGKIIWLKTPNTQNGKPRLDDKNPNKSLRKRPLLGLVILTDFIYESGEFISGSLYDPYEGETYNCKMWLENSKTLKVRGYWGFLFETETWIKQ